MTQTTDFGFKTVERETKASMVRDVFDSVAPKYDVMNDLMSLGLHRAWKQAFVAAIGAGAGDTLLDLASGTGDVAFLAKKRGAGKVILADINAAMLGVGQGRALQKGLAEGLTFLCCDAEKIPLPSGSVERVSMAFGLRNCTDKDAVLREGFRVLRPGGRMCVLEFSTLEVEALKLLYDTWSFKVLPAIGGRIANDAASYQYLAESIRMFPDQATLGGMMEKAGFERVKWQNLSGGIVAIHSGWKF
jgi:demethylmenaquinone methyltransferase/2-methoxy-6-polyprenyl-1,4-benzoquinol methylase